MTAEDWIRRLALEPHPEGGFFRETWRSPETLPGAALPARFGAGRSLGTAILYLLRGQDRSRLHRLHADEIWHFHCGGPLILHLLEPSGGYERFTLGPGAQRGEVFQCVVPHGCWFGAEPADGVPFALAGCTVAPGFSYDDFELAERGALLASHPRHRALIERMTPPKGS